jgi:hypothetical protein
VAGGGDVKAVGDEAQSFLLDVWVHGCLRGMIK